MTRTRGGLLVSIALLALVLGIAGWYLGPAGKEFRLGHSDLVELDRETERNPNDGITWYYFGARLRAKGASDRAAVALNRATTLLPDDNRVRLELGWAQLDIGEIDAAFQNAKAVIGTSKGTGGHQLLARLYQRTGAYHKAQQEWNTVLQAEPSNDRAWYFTAFCFLQMQQVDKAAAAADRALALNPKNAPFLRLRASIAAARGDLPHARSLYEAAVQQNPKDPRSYHELVNYLLTQPSPEVVTPAEQALARLRELDPTNQLIPWHEARLAVARQDWKAAIERLEQVQRVTPGVVEVHFQLANAYYRAGQNKAGDAQMAMYRKRTDLNRRIDELRIRREVAEDPDLLFRLAALEREAGRLDEAERDVSEGLRLRPDAPAGLKEMKLIRSARGSVQP